MGKPKGGKPSGGGAGPGGGGNGKQDKKKTVDAAALGLSGATPAPSMLPLSAGANPNPVGGMDPNMLSMMAMAGALGNGSQNVNVAFSQQQLVQMMQLVQAGNAAQQATAEAEKAKQLDEAIAKATQEKQSRIADLEAKLKSKKTTEADQSEADTEPDEGEDGDGNAVAKASRGQKRKAKVQNKMALAQTEKAELEIELAKARAETEIAKQKATQMETTINLLREGEGGTPRTRSSSDGAIANKILQAERQAELTTPVKQAMEEIVATQLAAIREPPVSKIDLTKQVSPSPSTSSKRSTVRMAPEAKYKDMASRIEAKKKGIVVPLDAGDTDQGEAPSQIKMVMQILDSSLAKLNKGKPLDTVVTPDEEDQEELEESAEVLLAPFDRLTNEKYGTAVTELVEGLGNKYGVHMETNCPRQFMLVVLYNMVWQKVYVEDEPKFAELQGFKAVKAEAEPRKSSRTKAGSKKKK